MSSGAISCPSKRTRPAVGHGDVVDDAYERRLAGAVGAEEAVDRPSGMVSETSLSAVWAAYCLVTCSTVSKSFMLNVCFLDRYDRKYNNKLLNIKKYLSFFDNKTVAKSLRTE